MDNRHINLSYSGTSLNRTRLNRIIALTEYILRSQSLYVLYESYRINRKSVKPNGFCRSRGVRFNEVLLYLFLCLIFPSNSKLLFELLDWTLHDCNYILRLMWELMVIPLGLQITGICGNVMVSMNAILS